LKGGVKMSEMVELYKQLDESISDYNNVMHLHTKICDCDPAVKSYIDDLYIKNLACLRDIQEILKKIKF